MTYCGVWIFCVETVVLSKVQQSCARFDILHVLFKAVIFFSYSSKNLHHFVSRFDSWTCLLFIFFYILFIKKNWSDCTWECEVLFRSQSLFRKCYPLTQTILKWDNKSLILMKNIWEVVAFWNISSHLHYSNGIDWSFFSQNIRKISCKHILTSHGYSAICQTRCT